MVGFAVDYVVHLGHSYLEAEGENRGQGELLTLEEGHGWVDIIVMIKKITGETREVHSDKRK